MRTDRARASRRRLCSLLVLAGLLFALVATAHAMGIGARRHHESMGRGGGMMGPPPSAGENPLSPSAAVLAEGRAAYEAHCAACHGLQGRGDGPAAQGFSPPPPDLLWRAARWSDGQIAAQILAGRGSMPPMQGVLEADTVWSIVHHLRRLQR